MRQHLGAVGPGALSFSVACDALACTGHMGPVQFPGLRHAGSALRLVGVHRDSGVHTHSPTLRNTVSCPLGLCPRQAAGEETRTHLRRHPHPTRCFHRVLGSCSSCCVRFGLHQQETETVLLALPRPGGTGASLSFWKCPASLKAQ